MQAAAGTPRHRGRRAPPRPLHDVPWPGAHGGLEGPSRGRQAHQRL